MRWLQVVPVLGCCFPRCIAELTPPRHRPDLIDHKRQWMFAVTWFIIMDRTQPAFADPTRSTNRPQSCPVLPAQVSIRTPRISYGPHPLGICFLGIEKASRRVPYICFLFFCFLFSNISKKVQEFSSVRCYLVGITSPYFVDPF